MLLAILFAYFFAIVIAFSSHEFAHAFTAYKLGDPTAKAMGRVTLNPFKHLDLYGMLGFLLVGFGWAKPVQINPMNFKKYRRDTFLVSISGVLTNLLLAFIFTGIYMFFFLKFANVGPDAPLYNNYLLYMIHYFLVFSIALNISLFCFNLIPIYPLDGFNAINSLFRLSPRFVNFMYKYGNIILIIFVFTPLFSIAITGVKTFFLDIFLKFWRLFI